jgi:NADPH-dependent 2,4-dienoyl-CoA reductase/sulfur reductase-like enzyme
MESIFRKGRVECLVNPALGREKEMAIKPAEQTKSVMVIGGGPGGANVAWVAARRGHEVHLFEKQAALGGQLIPGSISGYKKEIRSLISFQESQIRKFGVHLHLEHEATVDTVKEMNPDVIILSTGSVPSIPPVDGIERGIVVSYGAVLNGDQPTSKNTVVVGGGPIGCEVALHLSEYGSQVTLVEMLSKVGTALESITRKVLINKLKENGVKIMTGWKLSGVQENGVVLTGQEGVEQFVEAERVVVTIGSKPDNSLYEKIKSHGYEIHRIGDCLEPRSAKAAIYEGAVIGRAI